MKNGKLKSIAVFSLAIAMALSVVVLSVSNAVLLRPPLARDADRLVTLYTVANNHAKESFSYLDYEYIRDHSRIFSGVAALGYDYYRYAASYRNHDEVATVNALSDNYFEVMGIQPLLGKFFTSGDDRRHVPAAVLTYSCWKRWGAEPGIVGKTVTINRYPLTIVGVSPKALIAPVMFGLGADVIVNLGAPARIGGASLDDREERSLLLLGRLHAGTTRRQARAEVRVLWSQLAAAYPKAERNRTADLTSATLLAPDEMETARLILAVLIAAALLTLSIACANAANLMLALTTERRQEALIKTVLGASRWRLIGEFLKETAVLCAAAGVLGYAMALAALAFLSRFEAQVPVIGSVRIAADLHPGLLVAALTLALIVLASIGSGLAPALYASQPNLASALSGEIAIGGTRRGVIRNTMVVIQVALCTLVLVGTGLCWRSLDNLRRVDPGFSGRRIVMIFPDTEGLSKDQGFRLQDEMRRLVKQIGGVESVSLVRSMPLGGFGGNDFAHEEIRLTDGPASGQKAFAYSTAVDQDYFSTLGIRVLAGRPFRSSDMENSAEVIVINRFMAEQYWPHQDPLGRTIRIAHRLLTIVGVAADGKYGDLDEPQLPFMYHALGQRYQSDVTPIARTKGDPRLWVEPISRAMRQSGLKLPLPPVTMESWMNLTLFYPLLALASVGGLSIVGMLLATAGLYGAISYSVGERGREIGIRVALGARPAQLMQLLFRETLRIAGTGVLAGLALGVAASAIFQSQFYGIHRLEWYVLTPVAMAMMAVSLAIAFASGWRWTRMNPMDAVRHA